MSSYRTTDTFRRAAAAPGSGFYRSQDVGKRTFGYSKWFIGWAYFNLIFGLIVTLEAYGRLMGGYGWALLPVMTASCFAQIVLGSALFRLPTKIPWSVFLLLVYFFYAIISTMQANKEFGRSMEATFGWHTQCLVWYAASCLSCMQAAYCSAKFRSLAKWTMVGLCCFSCFVAIGQNFHLPLIETVFPNRILSEVGVIRAAGLADYPSQLGFQGMLGMVIIGAPIAQRNLRWWEWAMIGICALGILCAQYRSMYYAGLGLSVILLITLLWKRDRTQSMLIGLAAVLGIALILVVAPNNFSYGTRGAVNDPALNAREYAWKQTEEAQLVSPLTGIGADYSLLLASVVGPGYDKWSTNSIDNLYLAVRTCYGWVGVFLAAMYVIIHFSGLFLKYFTDSEAVSSLAIACIASSISVLVFSFTGNSVVYPTVGCNMAILAGISTNSWKEEAELRLSVERGIKLRKLVQSMSRRLGINLG